MVRCLECVEGGRDDRGARILDHVKKTHGLTKDAYLGRHPGAPLCATAVYERRKATVSSRYDGALNVSEVPSVKAKARASLERKYGGVGAGSPEIREKIERTNSSKYRSSNPFGSKEIQSKIKATNLARFNCENPNQNPGVIEKRVRTNRAKYGADHYLETEAFREKFVASSQERFGADHPMKSEGGKQLCFDSVQKKYGVGSVFELPEFQEKAYEANLANHGGRHSQKCPEVLAKARETWLEKYGTDNPARVEAVKQKIKDVWEGKYGVPFPPQSLGFNQTHSSPNGLEKRVQRMCPVNVLYSGDMAYPVRLHGTSRDKYPDFVVLAADQFEKYQAGAPLRSLRIRAVIEAFGTHWHGPKFTRKSRQEHANDVVEFYGRCGLQCLILWEDEVDKRPAEVAVRINEFLSAVAEGVALSEELDSVLDLFE